MSRKKLPVGLINTFSSLLLQFVTIINGFIIPRIVLSTFGSETNGLISSLGQFLNYIALLEGGVNGVIMASLYKPLAKGDNEKISSIVRTSSRFFRRISVIFAVYAVGLAVVYPLLSNSSFDFSFICILTLILSIKLFSQYCFSLSYQNLLNAGKRGYIISLSKIALIVLDVISVIVITNLMPNVHLLELVSALIYLIQPLIFHYAVKKYFKVDKNAKLDSKLIKNRWDGLSINIAYFIHTNTDIALLTIFTNLQTISVYAVYSLVANGISKIINSITSAISPSIGNLYALGDKKELNKKFDLYEYITLALVFVFFGVGVLLITPFVMIYTKNINDANYLQPVFGILLLFAEGVYALRSPYVNLAYDANKFKEISKYAYIETAINIVTSVILVSSFGLVGVAIGTLAAMVYRTVAHVFYLKNNILYRPVHRFFNRVLVFLAPIAAAILLFAHFYPVTEYTIMNWLIHAAVYTATIVVIVAVISFVFFKNDLNTLKKYLKHRH